MQCRGQRRDLALSYLAAVLRASRSTAVGPHEDRARTSSPSPEHDRVPVELMGTGTCLSGCWTPAVSGTYRMAPIFRLLRCFGEQATELCLSTGPHFTAGVPLSTPVDKLVEKAAYRAPKTVGRKPYAAEQFRASRDVPIRVVHKSEKSPKYRWLATCG